MEMQNYGVTFGNKHSLNDLGLVFVTKKISKPEPQTKMVSVPGRNGDIDMSEVLTQDIRYKNRQIEIKFRHFTPYMDRASRMSELMLALHGQKMKIIFDDDPGYYYWGRVTIDQSSINGKAEDIIIHADCDPYKYNITTSAEDWLWDPFNFETDVINETANIEVDGQIDVTIVASRKMQNVTIDTNKPLIVQFSKSPFTPPVVVNVEAGKTVLYDIILTEGENTLSLIGEAGTVATIEYIGGML